MGVLLALLLGLGGSQPTRIAAQTFATNTPAPTPNRPDAPAERYALRLWTEDALISALIAQIEALRPTDADGARAVRLLQRELVHRYPAAPTDAAARDALLDAVRAAPPGSVDARSWLRGYAQDALNAARPVYDATAQLQVGGWRIELTAANFDGRESLDALVRVVDARADSEAETAYTDAYYIALVNADGSYRLLTSDVPSAWFVGAPRVEYLGDLTGDGSDDLALGIDQGDGARRLILLGVRGERAAYLALPGTRIDYADVQFNPLIVTARRVRSARWGCISEQIQRWEYARNVFNIVDANIYTPQETLACALDALEPLYVPSPAESFARIASLLSAPRAMADALPARRATLAQAILMALNGDLAESAALARTIDAAGDPYLARQAAQFIRMADERASALAICGALAMMEGGRGDSPTIASPGVGLCDPDLALYRALIDNPPIRDLSLIEQLTARGLNISGSRVVREVGRLDRTVVSIALGGAIHELAFALPTNAAAYTVEWLPPADVRPTGVAAMGVPDSVYALLLRGEGALIDGDLRLALTTLENLPGGISSLEAQFVRAWINDLLSQRALAAGQYYALWSAHPTTAWGQLAAAHLERR
jgi:hypothetical protein